MKGEAIKSRKMHMIILSLLILSPLHAGNEWETVLDKDDIKGYSRAVPGSDILEFRSTVAVDAKIEVVGAVLRNVEGLKESSKYCAEARYIEMIDKNNYTFYVRYAYSPPISDRDAVIKVTTRYDFSRGRAVSDLVAVKEPLVPEKQDCIRIHDYRAQFVIEYISRDMTGIVFTQRLDPRGYIPSSIVNYMSRRALYSSAMDLRKAVKKEKYIEAAEKYGDRDIVQRVTGNPAAMKSIIANRLGDFIRDAGFVKRIVDDERVAGRILQKDGGMQTIMLHGWGSFESKRAAVKLLLRMYLGGFISDEKKLNKAVTNGLAEKILSGDGGSAALQNIIDTVDH